MSKKKKLIILILGITVFSVALIIYFSTNTQSDSNSDGFKKNFPLFIIWIPILTSLLAGRLNMEGEEEISQDKWLKVGILIALGAIGLFVLIAFLLF